MRILIFGAAGFIGTNLSLELTKKSNISLTLVDNCNANIDFLKKMNLKNAKYIISSFGSDADFLRITKDQDIIVHLISSTIPATSNNHISLEIESNVIATSKMLDACIENGVKKVIFISSGGTVYGKDHECPLKEEYVCNPITSYGIQKLSIEKLLYLYNYLYNLDYRIIRLSNPYGRFQKPNGILGAITTFTYQILNNKEITVYGDGSVIRDFIYIEDAIKAIINISFSDSKYKLYNVGSGSGLSINDAIETISKTISKIPRIKYVNGRKTDIQTNYLDVTRYEREFGKLAITSLSEGVLKTVEYIVGEKNIN